MDLKKQNFIFIIITVPEFFLLHSMKHFIYRYRYLIGIGDIGVVQAPVENPEFVRLSFNKIIKLF